jgi:hypothetical protein
MSILNFLWKMITPFRFKYWVVGYPAGGEHQTVILKARFFIYFSQKCYLIEGPFNTMEEAESWIIRWDIRHIKKI